MLIRCLFYPHILEFYQIHNNKDQKHNMRPGELPPFIAAVDRNFGIPPANNPPRPGGPPAPPEDTDGLELEGPKVAEAEGLSTNKQSRASLISTN